MCSDLRGRPGRKFTTKIQHGDAVADVEDQVHVVLDQQDPTAGRYDLLDERPKAGYLIGREAGGWFVEEPESGAQHECAGDFHEAELAVLQPVRALVRERLEANDS